MMCVRRNTGMSLVDGGQPVPELAAVLKLIASERAMIILALN